MPPVRLPDLLGKATGVSELPRSSFKQKQRYAKSCLGVVGKATGVVGKATDRAIGPHESCLLRAPGKATGISSARLPRSCELPHYRSGEPPPPHKGPFALKSNRAEMAMEAQRSVSYSGSA